MPTGAYNIRHTPHTAVFWARLTAAMTSISRSDGDSSDEEAATQVYREFQVNQAWINPLHNKTPAEMNALVTAFLQLTNLDEDWHTYIRRGAFLAQDPSAYGLAFDERRQDGYALRPSEIRALRMESSKVWRDKWDQPMILFALVACCSLGAAGKLFLFRTSVYAGYVKCRNSSFYMLGTAVSQISRQAFHSEISLV